MPRDVNLGEVGDAGGDDGKGGIAGARQAFWSGGKRGTFQGRNPPPPLEDVGGVGTEPGAAPAGDAADEAESGAKDEGLLVRAGGAVRVEFTIVDDCGGVRGVNRGGEEEEEEEEEEEGSGEQLVAGCQAGAFTPPPPLTLRVEVGLCTLESS
jgi:hypothetical protein